nr:MAG TPA_asm: hypothetical protein [Caudoviricetes sp.]
MGRTRRQSNRRLGKMQKPGLPPGSRDQVITQPVPLCPRFPIERWA